MVHQCLAVMVMMSLKVVGKQADSVEHTNHKRVLK